MDDVIERMVTAMSANGAEGDDLELASDVIAALLAVSDTHKLVPLEPTEDMLFAVRLCSGAERERYMFAVKAAPDLTEIEED